MTRPPPYLVVWTGKRTGLQEYYIAWTIDAARTVATHRKARIYRMTIAEEVD